MNTWVASFFICTAFVSCIISPSSFLEESPTCLNIPHWTRSGFLFRKSIRVSGPRNTWTVIHDPSTFLVPTFYVSKYIHVITHFYILVCSLKKKNLFNFNTFYFFIIWEGIGFMWKITFGIFIKFLGFETPCVRKDGFYKSIFAKIKNSIFPPKYTIYGKVIEKENSLFQKDLQTF